MQKLTQLSQPLPQFITHLHGLLVPLTIIILSSEEQNKLQKAFSNTFSWNWHQGIIDSGNHLALNWWQAITSNHDYPVQWYQCALPGPNVLTHWGRVTHTCVGKLTIIGSDNGLSPERRQAIIWTNAGILLIGPLETNFSEILIEIQTFSLKKIHLKMSSAKCCSFHLGLNVLSHGGLVRAYDVHSSWSASIQVMVCWLKTPSHYLNQCWLVDNWILAN